MIRVLASPAFKKTFKKMIKANPDLRDRFQARLLLFVNDPFDPILRTHKLSGKLSEYWSFRVTHDLRVVFAFEGSDLAILVDFGSHDEVY